ncbi:MAG: cyclic nucleotide-binding protein [Chloroflexota bacterium]|nr:MAG: cyclic nucleotide-binding protein [Chloroflexota bacterium]HWP61915.1 Crp/Fnr family transcriptional regulator [Candidatus Binatia bacterium]
MSLAVRRSWSEKVGLLRELELFAGLSEADIEAIGHATTMTHCQPGQLILSPDDPPDRIHILKRGRVRVYRVTPDGKQLTLDIYERGTILGDMRLIGQDRIAEAYAEALDEAIVCTITPDELRRLIERYPVIAVNIISHLSRRLQEAERELESMAYQRVGQRLARKLIDLAERFGIPTGRGTLIGARLTQQELAEMIGTTRETLAHTLSDFRRRGLLETLRQQVIIRDAERLAGIADGDLD